MTETATKPPIIDRGVAEKFLWAVDRPSSTACIEDEINTPLDAIRTRLGIDRSIDTPLDRV